MTTTHYTVQIIYQEELERPKWHPKKCEHATCTVIRLEVLWEMPKFNEVPYFVQNINSGLRIKNRL